MTGGAVDVATGGVVAVVAMIVLDTEPLSPPPRMTTVQITAIKRIAPATPATQIQRRSMGSSYS
jgi:hypothetical protein